MNAALNYSVEIKISATTSPCNITFLPIKFRTITFPDTQPKLPVGADVEMPGVFIRDGTKNSLSNQASE